MTVVRASLVILALAACAWFMVGIRQAQDTQRAMSLVSGSAALTPAQARHATSLLDSARSLNPDLTVDVLRGELALDQHQFASAVRILNSAARREPQNLQAWLQLAFAAGRLGDRQLTVAAAQHVSTLFPKLK